MIPRRLVPALALIVAAAAAAGCTEIRAEGGKRPPTSPLEETLRTGVSTPDEVRAALGTPDGDGMILLPIDAHPRKTWSYYYENTRIRLDRNPPQLESRRIFLFVYFDNDRYDGYLWFSSLND